MSKRVRWVGTAAVTDYRYGFNAYKSVMAAMDDGSLIPVICGHGGSGWLCLECARIVEDEQRLIDFDEQTRKEIQDGTDFQGVADDVGDSKQ